MVVSCSAFTLALQKITVFLFYASVHYLYSQYVHYSWYSIAVLVLNLRYAL